MVTVCQGSSSILDAWQHYSFNVNGCNPLESVLRHANALLQNTDRLSRVNCFRVIGGPRRIRHPSLVLKSSVKQRWWKIYMIIGWYWNLPPLIRANRNRQSHPQTKPLKEEANWRLCLTIYLSPPLLSRHDFLTVFGSFNLHSAAISQWFCYSK